MGRFTHMRKAPHPEVEPPTLIGADEVARAFGVSRATVNRWAHKGVIPTAHVMNGRTGARLFDLDTIKRLSAERAS